jgi:hypothetical protein
MNNVPSPRTGVVVGTNDLVANDLQIRVDGNYIGASTLDQGGGTFGNHTYNIGASGNGINPFSGHLYAGGIIFKHLSPGYLNAMEAWLKSRTPL